MFFLGIVAANIRLDVINITTSKGRGRSVSILETLVIFNFFLLCEVIKGYEIAVYKHVFWLNFEGLFVVVGL